MSEDNKMYLLKMKYSVIDVTKDKENRKITRKKEKLYLVKDPHAVDEKLAELEESLLEVSDNTSENFVARITNHLRKFGSLCNSTYFRMLRT
ncbi:MAG: hypothetical protein CL868_18120 [Cytophagaceae bacterium]|nr:hypothetical protein [Cytophagaceae bacterium]|tara:strand:- start:6698 stop:6973 length:276 start_codon:yes stop_codon:yes gene_type:complete